MDFIDKRRLMGFKSVKELSEASGVGITPISRIEQGKSDPDNVTLGNALKLAKCLNVSLEELYDLMIVIAPTGKVGNPGMGKGFWANLKKQKEKEGER